MKDVKIRVFGISGSPRKGSTDYVVRDALRYAEEKYHAETEYFSAHNKTLNFCTSLNIILSTR